MTSGPVQIGTSIQDGGWSCEVNTSQTFLSFSSVLVWIGENDTKTQVWMKLFCFVFAEMKTDTFENALVLMGPKFQRAVSIVLTCFKRSLCESKPLKDGHK